MKVSSATSCVECPAGEACSDPSSPTTCNTSSEFAGGYAKTCFDCSSTSYNCVGTSSSLCSLGEYVSGGCQACTAGNQCLDRTSLTNCGTGEYNVLGDDVISCQECTAGSKCANSNASPVGCAATQIPNANRTGCSTCTVQCGDNQMGKSFACGFGEYNDNNVCTACPSKKSCTATSSSTVSKGQYSPPGYKNAYTCVDFVKCNKNGVTYTPCNEANKFNSASNVCESCSTNTKYCPNGSDELNTMYFLKAQNFFDPLPSTNNQYWKTSSYAATSNQHYSPILYQNSLRAPKYGQVKSGGSTTAHTTSLARLGTSRGEYPQEVPDFTPPKVYTTLAGNYVLVDTGKELKQCLIDRVPNKTKNQYCEYCQVSSDRTNSHCHSRNRLFYVNEIGDIAMICPFGTQQASQYTQICSTQRMIIPLCSSPISYFYSATSLTAADYDDNRTLITSNIQCNVYDSFTSTSIQNTAYVNDDTCLTGQYTSQGMSFCGVNQFGYLSQREAPQSTENQDACESGYTCSVLWQEKYIYGVAKTQCPFGMHGWNTGGYGIEQSCKFYDQGSYNTEYFQTTATCEEGYYCPGRGSHHRILCPTGYTIAAGGKSLTDCLPCDAGTICEKGKSVSGVVQNKYALGGTEGRISSVAGREWVAVVGTKVTAPNYRDQSALTTQNCPNGTKQTVDGGSSLLSCDKCPDDNFCTSGTEVSCTQPVCRQGAVNGQSCDSGLQTSSTGLNSQFNCDLITSATSCQAGYFCPNGFKWTNMFSCSPSQKRETTGASVYSDCAACTDGKECGFGSSSETNCSSGFYCKAGNKLLCDSGKGTSAASQSSCTECSKNLECQSWENRDAGTQYKCPVGYYNNSTSGLCEPTPDNKKANTGTGDLQPPADGKTAYSGTQINCEDGFQCVGGVRGQCAAGSKCSSTSGTYTKVSCADGEDCSTGTSFPAKCGPGLHTLSANSSNVCPNVVAGSYTIGDGSITQCPVRFYCEVGSTVGYQVCPDGKTTIAGKGLQTDCTDCALGNYCIDKVEQTCSEAGFICPAGKSEPQRCAIGQIKTAAGQATCDDCTLGYYCPFTAMSTVYAGTKTDYNCQAGYYCPTGSKSKKGLTNVVHKCPEGQYCQRGSSAPSDCGMGKYRPFTGGATASDCYSCPKGRYCGNSLNTGNGLECDAGYYCTGGAQTAQQFTSQAGYYSQAASIMQLPCLHGTYTSSTAQSSCAACDAGKYCPGVRLSSTTDCDEGYYCVLGSINPKPCPHGTFRVAKNGTLLDDCTACSAGKYCSDYALTAISGTCDAGYFCTTKARIAKPVIEVSGQYGMCPRGKHCVAGSTTPVDCPAGKFRSSKGAKSQSQCQQCLEGHLCGIAGMSVLDDSTKCQANKMCPTGSSTQTACTTDHSYCPKGSAVQISCANGYQRTASGASAVCTQCAAGSFCSFGAKTDCPKGYYCPAGSSAPVPCEAGKYNGNLNQSLSTACLNCPVGKACPNIGIATPEDCDTMFFCLEGSSQKKPVDAAMGGIIDRGYHVNSSGVKELCNHSGLVCNREGTVDQTDSSTLNPCSDGYFCDFATKAVIVTSPRVYATQGGNICPAGYSCSLGAKTACPAGQYTESTGTKTCLKCALGMVCPSGDVSTAPLSECPSGHYCDQGTSKQANGTIDSHQCQAGYQCPANSHEEIICQAGYYQPATGQTSCVICPPGSFCPPSRTAITSATPCTPGHKCNLSGMTHPTPCPPGTYQKNSGEQTCLQCQAGYYCPQSKTSTDGVSCKAGFYCPLGSKDLSNVCPRGYYCPAGASTKTACDAGKYCAEEMLAAVSGNCQAGYICNAGTIANGGSKVPNPTDGTFGFICPAGNYCLAGASSQTVCPKGKYWDGVGASQQAQCKACPPKYTCTTTQLIQPADLCPAGKFCVGETQTDCPVGYYCPEGSHEKLKCQPGTYQDETAKTSCKTCEAGSYCYWADPDNDPNTLTGSEITAKLPCQAGFYCPSGTGYPGNYPCPVGTFTSATNLVNESGCTQCTEGSYCDKQGLTAVTGPCTDGYVCKEGSSDAAPRNSFCPVNYYCVGGVTTECPAGTFTHGTGARSLNQCIKCSPGWVCPNHSSSKVKCPAGSICGEGLSSTTIGPAQCEAGYYCKTGSYVKLKCPIGTFNATPGSTSCTTCTVKKLCATQGLPAAGTCTDHFYCKEGSSNPQHCPEGQYENGDQCVSCPAGRYCWPTGSGSNNKGVCAPGHVCQGGSWAEYPYYAGALDPQFQVFTTYNGLAYVGYYTNGDTSSNQKCLTGTYQNSKGATVCKPCPIGFYCSTDGIGITPPLCTRGTICPQSSTTATNGSCEANKFCQDGAVRGMLCPDGYEPNSSQNGCQKCAQGKYCHIDSVTNAIVQANCRTGNECQITGISYEPLCPGGTYLNSNVCTSCPAGKFCLDATESGTCVSGYICEGGSKTPTPTSGAGGKYCPKSKYCLSGDTTPKDCPPKFFRLKQGGQQQTDCLSCQPGYICLEGLTQPISCPQGFYCVLGEDQARPCPVGTYSNTKLLSARADCSICPSGFYCNSKAMLNPVSCPVAHFCDQNTVVPDQCPQGTYRPNTQARSMVQCQTCLTGHYCPQESTNPITCSGSYFCDRGSAALRTYCGAGNYCSTDTKWLEFTCPVNNYCPRNSLTPTPCTKGQKCPKNSGIYQVCGAGRYTGTEIDSALGYYTCKDCPVGTYSKSAQSYQCQTCPAGYYCIGATPVKYPQNQTTQKGYKCPAGYYCQAGVAAPVACPKGTYRSKTGGQSISDCIKCPSGSYNRFQGQSACRACGPDADSSEGAFTCNCKGTFRAFQYSDTSCRCGPGYEFIDQDGNELSQESSSQNCAPKVLVRCTGNQVRTLDQRCVDKNDCASTCNGGSGVRSDATGECECTQIKSLDSYCDDGCRYKAEQTTMPTSSDKTSLMYFNVVDDTTGQPTGAVQSYEIESGFNFVGKLACEVNVEKGCKLRHCQHSDQGKVFGSYGPSTKLLNKAKTARLLLGYEGVVETEDEQQMRELQTSSTSTVPNPVMCVNLGDGMLFEINSPRNYPVYLKDSLINSNPAFDFGQFKQLENRMKGLQTSATVTFAEPYYFGFTFTQSGNYAFADAADADQQTIVAVMAEKENCLNPDQYIQPRSSSSLQRLGVGFRSNIYLEADYIQIILIVAAFIVSLGFIIASFKNFTSQAWSIKTKGIGFYRERQKDIKLLDQLEIKKDFYINLEAKWRKMQEHHAHTNQTEINLWQEEQEDMDEMNNDVLPDLENNIRKIMRQLEKAHQRKTEKNQSLIVNLQELEERLSELRLANEKLIQEEMARRNNQEGGVGIVVLDKPDLERRSDNEELERLKREQAKKEDIQKKEVQEMIMDFKKRRLQLTENINQNDLIDGLDRNKLLLQLEQQQKKMQDLLQSEKQKQEVEFRRLLKIRAENQKKKKGKLKELAQKIQRNTAVDAVNEGGIDALRELTQEVVENLDAGVVSDITKQIEQEKEDKMRDIEDEHRDKLLKLNSQMSLEQASIKKKELMAEHEANWKEAQAKLKEDRNRQRIQLIKKLEARKRKLYFKAVKQQAMKEAEQDQSVNTLISQLLGHKALGEIKQKIQKDKEELDNQKQEHRRDFKEVIKKHKENERRQQNIIEERLDNEIEKERDYQQDKLKEQKREIQNKKEKLKKLMKYQSDPEARDKLLSQYKEKMEQMDALIKEETSNQKEFLRNKLKERKKTKQAALQKLRQRQELEQVDRSAEHVRREAERERSLNLEEMEMVLGKLVHKMNSQQEAIAMGVVLKEKQITVDDIIQVFDKLFTQKMLEELSNLLAKQYNNKENILNSQLRQELEGKLAGNQILREEMKEELKDLEAQKDAENWDDETYRKKKQDLLVQQASKLKERNIVYSNQFKERQSDLLKELEKAHADQLMDLREKQIKSKISLFKKIFAPLGMDKTNVEKDLLDQLNKYNLEKSDDYNRNQQNIDAQKRALEQQLQNELKSKFSNYEQMLMSQKEDQRMLAAKRENLRKMIDEKKEKFKKKLEDGIQVSQYQQEQILKQHEAELEAISGAIEQERIRQMQFFKAQMQKKKRMKEYQDEKRKMRVANFVGDLNKGSEATIFGGGIFSRDAGIDSRKYKNGLEKWVESIKHKQQERIAVSTLLDAPRHYVSSINLKRIIEKIKALEREVKHLLKQEDRNIFI